MVTDGGCFKNERMGWGKGKGREQEIRS